MINFFEPLSYIMLALVAVYIIIMIILGLIDMPAAEYRCNIISVDPFVVEFNDLPVLISGGVPEYLCLNVNPETDKVVVRVNKLEKRLVLVNIIRKVELEND